MSAPYPWQHTQWRALTSRRRAGRMPHGLLLHGPAGTGKDDFAQRFAQALLCSQAQADGSPCGACQACTLTAAGTHPDLLRLSPEEDSKFIRVDQVRALSARLAGKSQLGGFRVALITPAERMNNEAANSLLKTLEEPGTDTVLLLISAQPARLPATVRSRCQRLAFPMPDADDTRPWLLDRCQGVDPEALLALADGAPLAALALAQEEGQTQRDALFADFQALVSEGRDPLQIASKWQGMDLERSLRWIGGWTSDIIRLQAAAAPPRLNNADRADVLAELARGLPRRALFAHLDRVGEARRLMHTAVSAQAVLEHVLVPLRNARSSR